MDKKRSNEVVHFYFKNEDINYKERMDILYNNYYIPLTMYADSDNKKEFCDNYNKFGINNILYSSILDMIVHNRLRYLLFLKSDILNYIYNTLKERGLEENILDDIFNKLLGIDEFNHDINYNILQYFKTDLYDFTSEINCINAILSREVSYIYNHLVHIIYTYIMPLLNKELNLYATTTDFIMFMYDSIIRHLNDLMMDYNMYLEANIDYIISLLYEGLSYIESNNIADNIGGK